MDMQPEIQFMGLVEIVALNCFKDCWQFRKEPLNTRFSRSIFERLDQLHMELCTYPSVVDSVINP